jgi:hypothetical protein
MNFVGQSRDFASPGPVSSDLADLSLFVDQAAKYGRAHTCKSLAVLLAARILPPVSFVGTESISAERLRARMNLPSIGASRVLAVLLKFPARLSIEEIAAQCGCTLGSAISFCSQLRSYLRGAGLGGLISAGNLDSICVSEKLIPYMIFWEEVQAVIAIVRDRQLFEFALRDRLKLSSSGETKLLRTLLLSSDDSIESAALAEAVPCDPASLNVLLARLRRSLKAHDLNNCIVTLQPMGTRQKALYGLSGGARAQFFQATFSSVISTGLLNNFEDLLRPVVVSQASLRQVPHTIESAWRRDSGSRTT